MDLALRIRYLRPTNKLEAMVRISWLKIIPIKEMTKSKMEAGILLEIEEVLEGGEIILSMEY